VPFAGAPSLLDPLYGRVLLAHHARVEVDFVGLRP
jgi:hypothetical protein